MPKRTTGRFVPERDALYITDNGAVLCGNDLGASAKHNGYDISGQSIAKITPALAREAALENWEPRCEQCGKTLK